MSEENEVILKIEGEEKTVAVTTKDKENPFSSGSIGYYAGGRMWIKGKDHIISVNVIQAGTKGKYKKG